MGWVIAERRSNLYVAIFGGREKLTSKKRATRMGNVNVAQLWPEQLRRTYSPNTYTFEIEEVK